MNLQLSFLYCNILVNPTFLYYYAKLCHKSLRRCFTFQLALRPSRHDFKTVYGYDYDQY